jgi:pyruvate formate lyase activating enzyme
MRIGGLQRFSLIDYPSAVSCVVFTRGCNFRCGYCHNPKLVYPELFEKEIAVSEVMDFLEERKNRLDGVVISGGEPTIHHDLPEFMLNIKAMGYKVKLDTNGSNPAMIKKIANARLADFFAMDIKAPFSKYSRVAGVSVDTDAIRRTISIINESGIPCRFRTTYDTSIISQEDIAEIKGLLSPSADFVVQDCVDALAV